MNAPALRLVLLAAVLVLVAGALAASESSLARVSRARAVELAGEGRRGAGSLLRVATDPAPTLNVSTFLRVLAESGAAVCVTVVLMQRFDLWWQSALAAVALPRATPAL